MINSAELVSRQESNSLSSSTEMNAAEASEHPKSKFHSLLIGAIGVVFGDIGTSPLYAIRESFHGEHGFAVNSVNILGALSLIFWSLMLIISLKYVLLILRADNKGEGGILALETLARKDGRISNIKTSTLILFVSRKFAFFILSLSRSSFFIAF